MSKFTKWDQILQLLGQLKTLIEENPEITNITPLAESALGQGFAEVEVIARPLSRHHLADSDEHTRQHYATLLAAFLLTNGPLSPDVFRLFSMLLQSLNLAGQQVNIITHASRIESADVVEYTRLAQNIPRLPQCLLMDALVIMRIDENQLSQKWEDSLNEWISTCNINTADINYCIELSDLILGNKSIDKITHNLRNQIKSIDTKTILSSSPTEYQYFDNNIKSGTLFKKGSTLLAISGKTITSPEDLVIAFVEYNKYDGNILTFTISHCYGVEYRPPTIKYIPILPELSAWESELLPILQPNSSAHE